MGDTATTECPWCGEPLEVWVEQESESDVVQDCDVCCRPCVVSFGWDERTGPWVTARRE